MSVEPTETVLGAARLASGDGASFTRLHAAGQLKVRQGARATLRNHQTRLGTLEWLGAPVMPFLPFFSGRVPTTIDYRKKGTLVLTLLEDEDGVRLSNTR